MKPTPIKKEIVDELIAKMGIQDFAKATIREVKQVAARAEKESGVEYIKMEMGIPGLPAAKVGVEAQIKALQDGIAHSYPDIQGYPELKKQASRFVKAFIGVDKAVFLSLEVCKAPSLHSSPVRRLQKGKIPCCSSIQVSPYRKCSCKCRAFLMKLSTFTISAVRSWDQNWNPTCQLVIYVPSFIRIPITHHGCA